MKRYMAGAIVLSLVLAVGLTGCGVRKAASAQEAINRSKSIKTVDEKKDYLMKQAQAFFNVKDFKTSIDIAQYILRKVDPAATEPKTLIKKAEAAMIVQEQLKAREVEEVPAKK